MILVLIDAYNENTNIKIVSNSSAANTLEYNTINCKNT